MSNITLEQKALRRMQSRQSMHQRKLTTRIRNLFSLCDEEGKGYVTRKELFRLSKEIALTEEEVNNAFHYLDRDKNGSLSLDEFMTGFEVFLGNKQVSSESFNHQEISDSSQLFDYIDKNRKGFITKGDLQDVSAEFNFSNDEIETIFLALHRKGRTVLTYQNFKEGLENISSAQTEEDTVAMDEEIFTNGIDEDTSGGGDVNMDYSEYGQDELKSILAQKATELFKSCDKDDKGYITQEDLLELTRELALTTEQIESAFAKLDKDKNNFLTLDEFIDGFGVFLGVDNVKDEDPETERRQAKAKELFDLCDNEGKGYVTKSDLMRLTNDLGLTKDQVSVIFDELDGDQNGFLTIYEFMHGFSEYMDDESLDYPLPRGFSNGVGFDEGDYAPNQKTIYEKQQSLDQLDSNAKLLISNIDECVGDSLTKEQVAELWQTLQKTDTTTLTRFEEFLLNITNEIKRAKLETVHLETTLKRKSLSHDIEVQRLYEEMEQQIKNEKSKVRELEARRERAIREEMKSQLQDKDYQLNKLLVKQREMEDRLFDLQQQEQNLKQENVKLSQHNSELEEKLNCSISSLEDTKHYVSTLQASTAQEKRDRVRAAMQASQGIQKEHESLIRQLDMLREMNQKLRDDKDAIESSMKMRGDRSSSIDEEIHKAEGKAPLTKTGSIMSNYFTSKKRGVSRTRNRLQKQGSLMSSYFEPSWESQESFAYEDNPTDEHFAGSPSEDGQVEWKRRVIKAVDEGGESMINNGEGEDENTDPSSVSTTYPMDVESSADEEQNHEELGIISSTPIREGGEKEESPTRRRRMLPTRHGGSDKLYSRQKEEDVIGHMKELRRKLSNEHELNEMNIDRSSIGGIRDVSDGKDENVDTSKRGTLSGVEGHVLGRASRDVDVGGMDVITGDVEMKRDEERVFGEAEYPHDSHDHNGAHTPGATEDQMSATESEADRMVNQIVDEESKESATSDVIDVDEQKQRLKDMLDDLATPYSARNEKRPDDNVSISDGQLQSTALEKAEKDEPPANPNRVYKIVFVGDSGVGKSSVIHRFCFNQFRTNFSATIGVDFQVKIVKVFQEWIALQLWDTAGQERFRSITKQYFRKADGVVIMFDLCSETSFKNVRNWMNSVEDAAEPECSVMLLGNKLDLAEDGMRKIRPEMGQKLARDFNCAYMEASAKSAEGVNEAMVKLARLLTEKEDSIMKMSVLNLDVNAENKKKRSCCSK